MTKKRLKVLQVGKYYPPVRGGIETHLELLCRGLQSSGEVDLDVIVANEGKQTKDDVIDGIRVQRLGTLAKLAGAPICPGMHGALRKAKADIVHIHTPHPTALLTYATSGCRGQLVCTYHSDIVRQRFLGKLIGPVQDFAFRRAGAFVAASPAMMTASPVLKRYRDRCVVVPFGTDTKVSDALEGTSIDDVRQRFSGPITLAVGRLVSYKGFQHLIRAFAIAECPGTLLIVGDGPMDAALKAEIEAVGLQGRAHLLGNVPDTAPYYQACDLFVLPSVGRNEAFGLVQLEAMICGKPVINTQLDSGVPFVSRHEETGLTVPPADEVALGAAMTQLLSDEETRIRYGTAARSRVLSDFTAEKMIERTLAVYRRVASGSPGPARKQHLSFPVFARRGDTAN